jgi:hypothetical protein
MSRDNSAKYRQWWRELVILKVEEQRGQLGELLFGWKVGGT